jgi:2-keto-4-pentenoate hydratase
MTSQHAGFDAAAAYAVADLIHEIRLAEGGVPSETGVGANVLGNPLAAVVNLLQVRASRIPYQPL